jgi:hypothetical protein
MTEEEHQHHNQESEQRIINDVEEFGFHIALLPEDDYLPGFAYTIGLYQTYGHAEIICFGLKPQVMGIILNHAGDLIKSGTVLKPYQDYPGFLEGYPIQFLPVQKEHYPDYVGYAGWFNQNWEFPLLQLVWTDKQSLYPWQEGFNSNWKFKQPLLDRNTDFKFYEERNLGVYTTQQVLEGKPILYVYHNEDGDWQFHSEDDPNTEEGKLVALEQITRIDPSVNAVYYLPYGGKAWRESADDTWHIEAKESDPE